MLGRLGMLARGLAGGARAGVTGSFMRSAAGAAGYLPGHALGAFAKTPTGIGALAGGAWGAVSDDTSVLGGALIGAGAGRYGAAGLRTANRGGAGLGFRAHALRAGRDFGRGAWGQMKGDFTRLTSNMAPNGFSGLGRRARGMAYRGYEGARRMF